MIQFDDAIDLDNFPAEIRTFLESPDTRLEALMDSETMYNLYILGRVGGRRFYSVRRVTLELLREGAHIIKFLMDEHARAGKQLLLNAAPKHP